jgi:2-amino-4-hydroxy-6-hydroxymethyldihydropteridine diphosphokinase
VLTASSVYETAPQAGAIGQEDFLNAVLEVETSLDPFELLAACKDVEFELGRDPGAAHHAARPIDVDLLIAEGHAFESDRLTLPHPDILERRFVLEPLLEVDPELRLPDGSPLADALPGVREQRVTRAGPL